jgi:hypothetical protein
MVLSDRPLVIYDPHITLFQVNLIAPLKRQVRLPRIGRTDNDFQNVQATRHDSLMHQQPMQVPGMMAWSAMSSGSNHPGKGLLHSCCFWLLSAPDPLMTAHTHAPI